MTLRVRDVSDEAREELGRMARLRTVGAGLVRRAQIVLHALEGLKAPEISARMDLGGGTVRHWLKRFNAGAERVGRGRPHRATAALLRGAEKRRDQHRADPSGATGPAVRVLDPGSLGRLPERAGRRRHAPQPDQRDLHPGGPQVAARRDLVRGTGRPRVCPQKGAIERLYTAPPAGGVVVCLDEMGPQASKSYPGQRLVRPAGPKAERAKQEIDYGRRDVAGYVFGALQPATGTAFTLTYERRTTVNWVDFLSAVEAWIDPAVERVYAVLDNLNVHSAPDVLLFGLLHPRWEFVFQPKYAAYLNLIEPWWKVLRSLALKGRRFNAWAEIEQAVERATAYWNQHKHPFIWGRRRRHRTPRRLGIAAPPNIILI